MPKYDRTIYAVGEWGQGDDWRFGEHETCAALAISPGQGTLTVELEWDLTPEKAKVPRLPIAFLLDERPTEEHWPWMGVWSLENSGIEGREGLVVRRRSDERWEWLKGGDIASNSGLYTRKAKVTLSRRSTLSVQSLGRQWDYNLAPMPPGPHSWYLCLGMHQPRDRHKKTGEFQWQTLEGCSVTVKRCEWSEPVEGVKPVEPVGESGLLETLRQALDEADVLRQTISLAIHEADDGYLESMKREESE